MTRKQLENKVDIIAELLGLARTKEEAKEKGHRTYLSIDFVPCYGGYQLKMISIESGGEYEFYGCTRQTNKEFTSYLAGIIAGLSVDKMVKENRYRI